MFSFATSGPVCGKAHSLIDRPVDVVFHYVCDDFFSNYPKWSPEVRRLDALTGGPLTLGSMARQVRIDHGQQSESTFRVTEYRRPERVSFAGVSDPYRCCYEFQDIPSPPSTRITFTFELKELDFFMRPFEKLVRSAIQDGAQQTVNNIKRLIESQIVAEEER